MPLNIVRLEGRLLVIASPVGAPVYDFDFDLHFRCDHPHVFEKDELCVLRIGPVRDYAAEAEEKSEWGLRLINSPDDHHRASDIEGWLPLIADLTPKTRLYDVLPPPEEVEAEFDWPVFVKGSRQTARHNPNLAVARTPEEYAVLRETYSRDPILHWQRPVVRQFMELDPVAGEVPGKLRPSREFRTFWWRGHFVGCGQYWSQIAPYNALDLDDGLALAKEAARRVAAPFLVVDIARLRDGGWIVIECNDAQEAGYGGLPPQILWRNILSLIH